MRTKFNEGVLPIFNVEICYKPILSKIAWYAKASYKQTNNTNEDPETKVYVKSV